MKGKLLFAHVSDDVELDVDRYKHDRRNRGTWEIRRFTRDVKAGGAIITVDVVVVRERIVRCGATASGADHTHRCRLAAGHEGNHVDTRHPMQPTWPQEKSVTN